ncbi:hypothetical protein JCM1840_005725 [Sporobolomyces johnsonii]
MSNSDPGSSSRRPALEARCTSSGSSATPESSSSPGTRSSGLSHTSPPLSRPLAPAPPSHRFSNFAATPISSSPLSSASSAAHRRRQSSFSSNVSTTTEATSYDESGEECMSQDGSGDKEGGSSTSSSSGSFGTLTGAGGKRTSAPSSQEFLPMNSLTGAPPGSAPSSAHPVSIPPGSSLPISISTSIAPASVRLSTTPLFPSPLAQASGPEEDTEQSRGDEGDSEGEEDEPDVSETAWAGKAGSDSPLARDTSGVFGDMDLSPPTSTVGLPDANALGLEPAATPRPPPPRPRQRTSPTGTRDSSPEADTARTARTARVRSLGRASGLSAALNAADDAASNKRRSRHAEMSALAGLGVDTSRSGGFISSPTRSSALSSSLSSAISNSPPSPSSSLSVSPANVSRRTSINLVSPPRTFQPSSPTSAGRTRTSLPSTYAVPIPIPVPFPAAPPPSESIKLQKVPESVRVAVDIRQSALSSSYTIDAFMSGSPSRSSASAPSEFRLPKTPVATRAPSPASGSGSGSVSPSDARSLPTSQASSRGPSQHPSRQGSREKLPTISALTASSPGPSSSVNSAFSPLFPFQSGAAAGFPSPRHRSQSISVSPSQSLQQDPFRDAGELAPPRSTAQRDHGVSPPAFNLDPFGSATATSSGQPRTVSDTIPAPKGHKASASISSIGGGPNSRLAVHRASVAPGGVTVNSTDEYAQIILSTRNAKVRKWKTSPSPQGSASLEPATAASGKSWALAGGRNNSALGEQAEDGDQQPSEADITHAQGAQFGLQGRRKEIEWVDWLDEYRKMKEAKLRADEAQEDTEGTDGREGSPTREDETDRRSETSKMAELALTAAQKGKTMASSTSFPSSTFSPVAHRAALVKATEFNPFEETTANLSRMDATTGAFLTPGVPFHQQYFPMVGIATSPSTSLFQPTTTATPMTISDPPDFALLKPSTSDAAESSMNFGSPSGRRKRNFAKLGNKIDAWWSAVRSSFAGAEEDRPRHRRTSTDHPGPLTSHTTLEPPTSRTSSQFARPATPGTPGLRTVASAQDLSRSSMIPNPFATTVVPTGALAPAARVDSAHRLMPPQARQRTTSSGSEQESEGAATAKSWRNPHLSLNLGPSFNTMLQPQKPLVESSPSPSPSPATIAFGSPPPSAEASSAGPSSAPIPVPAPAPTPSDAPGLTPGSSPMWDRTPGLVPSSHFLLRERQSTLPATLPSRTETDKRNGKEKGKEKEKSKEKEKNREKEKTGFSMHTIRQQIRQRLASAKENCDHELRRIIDGISAYVETELHKDISTPIPPGAFDEGRFGSLVQDEASAGYASNPDLDWESEAPVDTDAEGAHEEAGYTDSDGGSTKRPPSRYKTPHLSATPDVSAPRRRSVGTRARSGSPRRASLAPRKRHLTSVPRTDLSSYPLGDRTTRSGSGSASSSRSNSRSRSPLPPGLRRVSGHGSRSPGHSGQSTFPTSSTNLAESAFIVLLQEIITVATEILDTPISKLTARPGVCAEYIVKVQQIGEAWNENPELPCRGWYVQLLLAVAGLSRVVEWWEAEKGFWSFEDADHEDAEPILFLSKAMAEDSPTTRARGESQSSISPAVALQPPGPKWSPLGIDLGMQGQGRPEEVGRSREPSTSVPEEEAKQRADELRQAVEAITSQTLLMELSLDGQLFQYLSSAWQDLVGLEPEECLDAPISDFLYPDDAAVFAEATRQLEVDDSHTVEVSFRLRVASSSQTSENEEGPEDLYEAMEGKGMLMLDGLTGSASHTMWVVRPALYSETSEQANQSLARFGLETFHRRSSSDPGFVVAPGSRINLEPILCRICERPTPAWFFEKHNETCNEVHRLESDISECNDRLRDILRSIDELVDALERPDHDEPPEYRGIPLALSPSPTPPTYLEGLRPPLAQRSSADQTRRKQQRIFDDVRDIVQTALSISTPSVSDESGIVPIHDQRLLSPNSESNLALVLRWQRPLADECALVRLVSDTEEQTRFKLNSVNRLRNTILYAEKIRQEWEAKASAALADAQEQERSEQNATLPFDSPLLQPLPAPEESPRHMDALDLPRPTQTLRRRISQPLGLMSPMVLAEDTTSQMTSSPGAQLALSPRIPSSVPSSRTKASSIKDFKILKPISKGAFGSVYLAKKITTGDYYAIKVLKKSDMVAKNQVTNVKAERMILMTQTDSNFVVKLFYTFQSKDYLYLVMEYLNGGDCAALVKNLGELPEDWAKRYLAEVIVGLEHLHSSGIVHRDLKPDNLLIDAKGHLKLTDFGLSRIGLLGRQTQLPRLHGERMPAGPRHSPSNASSPMSTPAFGVGQSQSSYFGNVPITDSFSLDTPSESSASGSLPSSRPAVLSPASIGSRKVSAAGPPGAAPETSRQHFVGTPDYLAPESILGVGMDACVDWWALGVICYEFLYGFPPFHDETPEKVFENILSRRIEWHEDAIEISKEAHDFMDKLLCSDPGRRLGRMGAAEVKAHPFLAGIDWDNLLKGPVDFVPKIADPESTDYFDLRGAKAPTFNEEDGAEDPAVSNDPAVSHDPAVRREQDLTHPVVTPVLGRAPRERSETAPSPHDDFGTFNFRNLTVLKQANDDVIRKMKDEQLLPPLTNPLAALKSRPRSRRSSVDFRVSLTFIFALQLLNAASDDRPYFALLSLPIVGMHQHGSYHARRNSMPSRLRKTSLAADPVVPPVPLDAESWGEHARRRTSVHMPQSSSVVSRLDKHEPLSALSIPSQPSPEVHTAPPAPAPLPPLPAGLPAAAPFSLHPSHSRLSTIDCLVAGRNPIVTKVLETMLQRLGCRVVVVPNGAEAILAAGGIPFDCLFLDLAMPVVDGEKAARMIKSTINPSANAPIVAVCSHPAAVDDAAGTLFAATLSKPIMKADLLAVLSHLNFRLEVKGNDESRRGSADDGAPSPKTQEDRRGSA